ncbi:MAG: hypothetical protein NEA02_04645, partial [Thermoanaerobaculia bacterium]|nr:hypothetical protein [Thermoanaerobaculia bacterium]
MTLMTPARVNDHSRAPRMAGPARTALSAMALLGLLTALPVRLEAQCTLSGTLKSFEPNPPGVSRGGTPYLGSGFSSNLALYQPGGTGPYRLLMQESFGYSVLDLTSPINPTALTYHDVRFPLGGPNSVNHGGDGQNDVQTIAVSPDGQRVAFSMTGPTSFHTVVGSPSGNGFALWGDFRPDRAFGTLVQHIGSRYIAYDFSESLTAADVTTLPTGSLQLDNMAGSAETSALPGGYSPTLAGNYIVYLSGAGIEVVNASNPGPIGSITAGYPRTTITGADFVGGRTIAAYSAAVDPADATKVWVLVELNALTGEKSPSYGLLYVTSGLVKVSAGPIWRVPSLTGEVWWSNPGPSSALIAGNGGLFVLMWAQRSQPGLFRLYSTTTAAWFAINASAPPGAFDIPTNLYSNFSTGQPMRGFAAAPPSNSLYAYLPTGLSAYMIPMTCVSQNAPAVGFMSVTNQAGAPLANNDTVFLGDLVTITPSVSPSPSSQPLTGFGWNFDFDFHAGAASDDFGAGSSPRVKAPDNGAIGSPPAPPAAITVVGPCDYQVGGTDPGSGAGCWTSVTTNSAFGGPDFSSASPPAGTTVPLTFAFEANNALGSAGASLFTLNWKVPAARLQSTQVLSGQPLVSGSDGHPTAVGFKWYFGDSPTALTLAPACTGPTCVPTLQTNGTHSYWLTAS